MAIRNQVYLYCRQTGLSNRESEVFTLLVHRVVNPAQVASNLGITVNTVNNHLKKILQKTNTENKAELLADFLQFLDAHDNKYYFQKRPSILLLDDENEFVETLAILLRKEGMEVHTFRDPFLAIHEIHKRKVDIVVTDINMPGMSGLHFLEELRKLNLYEPGVIFTSGYTHEYPELLDKGAFAFLTKPLDTSMLLSTIREYMYGFSPKDARPIPLTNSPIKLAEQDLGYGGFFLHQEHSPGAIAEMLQPGKEVTVKFLLPDSEKEFEANCQVVWERRKKQGSLNPGFGLIFHGLNEEARYAVREYVCTKNIYSFVPLGAEKA